jgi:ABC-type polysaccharide/polyol phosphate transport system ATPase subunit
MSLRTICHINLSTAFLYSDRQNKILCIKFWSRSQNFQANYQQQINEYCHLTKNQKNFGIKEILRKATFTIEEQDKVGLIEVNGGGKSTLLKIIAEIKSIGAGDRLWRWA